MLLCKPFWWNLLINSVKWRSWFVFYPLDFFIKTQQRKPKNLKLTFDDLHRKDIEKMLRSILHIKWEGKCKSKQQSGPQWKSRFSCVNTLMWPQQKHGHQSLSLYYQHWTLGTAPATGVSTAPGHWEPLASCELPLSPFLCIRKSEFKIWLVELSVQARKLALRESGKILSGLHSLHGKWFLPFLRHKMKSPEAKWSVNHHCSLLSEYAEL